MGGRRQKNRLDCGKIQVFKLRWNSREQRYEVKLAARLTIRVTASSADRTALPSSRRESWSSRRPKPNSRFPKSTFGLPADFAGRNHIDIGRSRFETSEKDASSILPNRAGAWSKCNSRLLAAHQILSVLRFSSQLLIFFRYRLILLIQFI